MSWNTQVPPALVADRRLTDAEFRVLVALRGCVAPAADGLVYWPGDARLAEMTSKSERLVRRIADRLEAKGYWRWRDSDAETPKQRQRDV